MLLRLLQCLRKVVKVFDDEVKALVWKENFNLPMKIGVSMMRWSGMMNERIRELAEQATRTLE